MNIEIEIRIVTFFLVECDIEYISPSNYKPPELRDKGTNGEVVDADDHYERLVRGSLKVIEKQKVCKLDVCFYSLILIENFDNFKSIYIAL